MTRNAPGGPDASPGDDRAAPLNYAPTAGGRLRPGLQMTLGAICSATLLLAIATTLPFLLGMFPTLAALGVGGSVVLFALLRARHSPASRGWAAGLLIGIGVGLLIYGVCWAFVARSMQH